MNKPLQTISQAPPEAYVKYTDFMVTSCTHLEHFLLLLLVRASRGGYHEYTNSRGHAGGTLIPAVVRVKVKDECVCVCVCVCVCLEGENDKIWGTCLTGYAYHASGYA